jgi:hypothetical protein
MQLIVQSLIIFFGTLMAAALIALGEPGGPTPAFTKALAASTVSPSAARVSAAIASPLTRFAAAR